MALHRLAMSLMVPVAVMVVLGQDVVWPIVLAAGRRITAWPPLLPLRQRLARLPAVVALPLFLLPELCSRCGTFASAWLLLKGDWWGAVAVYGGTKLLAGGTALWIYTACEPALLRNRLFALGHGMVAAMRDATLAQWRRPPARPDGFAALLRRVRESRSAWVGPSSGPR